MNREQQIEWEGRWARPAAAAAVGAAVLPVAAAIIRFALLADAGKGDRGALVAVHDGSAQAILYNALAIVGYLCVGAVVVYLMKVARARREQTPAAGEPLAVAGAVVFSVAAIINLVEILSVAGDFVGSGPRTERRADMLLEGRSQVGGALALGGGLALALSIVLASISAMRAGILSRFMGYIGVIVGAFNVIPLFPLPVVQMFWFVALAVLSLDRWPGGRGPAWSAMETIPWPSAADAAKARQERIEGAEAEPEPPSAPKPRRKKRRR